jgi:hypothetical protein
VTAKARIAGGLAVIVAACGCGGGDPGPMSGWQAFSGRDFGNLFFWQPRTLAFTRDAADASHGRPHDLLVWQIDEPEPVPALVGIDWTPSIGWPRRFVGDLLATGHQFERVYDLPNRQGANLFLDVPAPPEDGSRYTLRDSTAMRSDGRAIAKVGGEGRETIVVGRPPDLRVFTMPGGGSVAAIAFLGIDLALLLRQTTAAGDVVGVFRLDTSSGALAPLVAVTPAAEWAGVTGWCEDPTARCGGLFGSVGCAVDQPACPGGSAPPCLIYYAKVDADDTSRTAAYVHDVNAGTTSKLAGANPDRFFTDRQLLVWGSFPDKYTRYRNLCGGDERQCPFSPGEAIAVRPDGGGFTTYGAGNHLNVVNVSEGTCVQPDLAATLDALRASYAPGSDRLMWVALSETSRTLWLADGQGQSPVAVASGELPWSSFSPDGRTIYVRRYEDSRIALSWIDVTASPWVEQILSTNIGDVGALFGDRRVLFVDHFNGQDANGELVLVDRATGAVELLARSVTDVAVARATDAGTDVAYAVRGRGSSSRDGLWLTTLSP